MASGSARSGRRDEALFCRSSMNVRLAPTMVVTDVSARQTGPLPKAPHHLGETRLQGEVRVQARVVPAESKEDEGAHCFSREFQRKCRSHTDTIRGLVDAPSVYAKGMREGGGAGVPALRRASPPRHRPAWEADTLPAELLPLGRLGPRPVRRESTTRAGLWPRSRARHFEIGRDAAASGGPGEMTDRQRRGSVGEPGQRLLDHALYRPSPHPVGHGGVQGRPAGPPGGRGGAAGPCDRPVVPHQACISPARAS